MFREGDMIKVKQPDYPVNAHSSTMIDGEIVKVKASKAVVNADGSLTLYKRSLTLKLVEVEHFYPQEWEYYDTGNGVNQTT